MLIRTNPSHCHRCDIRAGENLSDRFNFTRGPPTVKKLDEAQLFSFVLVVQSTYGRRRRRDSSRAAQCALSNERGDDHRREIAFSRFKVIFTIFFYHAALLFPIFKHGTIG